MTRIVICRHGNTFDKGDVVTRVGARTDLPLSISGIDQARTLAEHFKPDNAGFKFKRAYCSSLLRTYQTADFILTRSHDVNQLKILDFLKEIDYGEDENKAEADVIARLGQKAITLWDKKAIPPTGWDVDPLNLIKSWKNFMLEQAKYGEDALVVTSNGIARFALDAVNETAIDAPRKLRTAAYGVIEINGYHSRLVSWDVRAN